MPTRCVINALNDVRGIEDWLNDTNRWDNAIIKRTAEIKHQLRQQQQPTSTRITNTDLLYGNCWELTQNMHIYIYTKIKINIHIYICILYDYYYCSGIANCTYQCVRARYVFMRVYCDGRKNIIIIIILIIY